jgi:rRNA maturation endonuclease Nob1
MKEQQQEMIDEIEELKKQLFESSKDIRESEIDIQEPQTPSIKELKDYSTKLQDELLKSDHNIKVLKAMSSSKGTAVSNKKILMPL